MIVFKTIIDNYYSCCYILSNFAKKLDIRKICIFMAPILVIVVNIIHDEGTRREFLSKTINYTLIYNIAYLTLICLIIFFKKGEKNENL